jgi:hypothetical protein
MYTAGNPIMLIDPDGRDIINFYKKRKEAYDNRRNELIQNRDGAISSGDTKLTKSYNKDIRKLDRKNKRMIKRYNAVESVISKMKKHTNFYNYYNNLENEAGEEVHIYVDTRGFLRGGSFMNGDMPIDGYDRNITYIDTRTTTKNGEIITYPVISSVKGENTYHFKISSGKIKNLDMKELATVFGNIEFQIRHLHVSENIESESRETQSLYRKELYKTAQKARHLLN